jgi:hypothetical protein
MISELIYIVDAADMPTPKRSEVEGQQNWVYGGQSSPIPPKPVNISSAGPILAGIAAATPLLSLAPALVAAAAVVSPILAGRFTSQTEKKSELGVDGKIALEQFVLNHALTIEMAKIESLRFPPGHPQVGISYKRHPLADMPEAGKERLYIPYEKYDSLLMEEREAELLKLLVYLGATRVCITRTVSCSEDKSLSAGVAANAKVGEVGLSTEMSTSSLSKSADTREFLLQGKTWRSGDILEKSRFAWVHFEPSWEALVIAREIGGCVKAGLEIRENTAFSTNKALNANVQGILYGGKVSTDVQGSLAEEKVYFVEAEFGKFLTSNGE